MSPNLNQRLELTFKSSFEFQSRHKKGWFRDQNYMGMYKSTLLKKGYSDLSLAQGMKLGLLEIRQIVDSHGDNIPFKMGYIYKGKRIDKNKITAVFKRLFKKIKN